MLALRLVLYLDVAAVVMRSRHIPEKLAAAWADLEEPAVFDLNVHGPTRATHAPYPGKI